MPRLSAATIAAVFVALAAAPAGAQDILKSETGNPGSTGHALVVVASKIYKRDLGIDIQINDSQTLTKSALKLGRGQIDLMAMPTAVYKFLAAGSRMYKKKLHKQAIAAGRNVRALFGFQGVVFHPVTFDVDGIKTWQDIKGKRVFVGPPAGAASVTVQTMIRALTGYEPNKDYKAIKLNWGSGLQAMMDGKLDLFVRPVNPGAAMIEQLGMSRKFRILDSDTTTEAWKKWLKGPGRFTGTIPANTYSGQVNRDRTIRGGAATFYLAVHKDMPDDRAYGMTRLFWDNLDEVHKTSVILKPIAMKMPFVGMNTALHPGAARYYKEMGIAIPARLLP